MTPKTFVLPLIATLLLGSACDGGAGPASGSPTPSPSRSSSTLIFPVQGPRNSVMQALFEGVIVRDDDCLYLGDAPDAATAVWPPGFTYEAHGDEVVILDDTGAEAARTGQSLRMGGGLVAEDGAPVPDELKGIVKGCPAPYWIVGEMD